MLASLAGWLSSWRYEASPDAQGKRDVRIDLLRGFCVFVMIVDHVGGETSWLYAFTGGNRFVVSAAEGFLLLSGFSMGMVHHVVIHRHGVRAMFEKVIGRAWLLYAVTVVLTVAFAAVSNVLADPYVETLTPARSKTDFFISVVTFHRTYSLTDILVLYTLLMLVAGPALWLLARGYTGAVLAASITTWAVAQLWPDRVPHAWQIIDGGFPFSAWQLMFIAGLVLGLRIGRILALFALASFAYALVTVWWVPLRRALGWLLLPMGRRALFAYGVQLFAVAFFASDLMAPVRLDRENAFFQAAAVAVVWLLCLAYPRVEERIKRLTARRPAMKTSIA